jgi:hypothetical protein
MKELYIAVVGKLGSIDKDVFDCCGCMIGRYLIYLVLGIG